MNKTFHVLFLILLGMNIYACNKADDVGPDDDNELDIQREEEYKGRDIRDHELDLGN
jgi:hypothetical protein